MPSWPFYSYCIVFVPQIIPMKQWYVNTSTVSLVNTLWPSDAICRHRSGAGLLPDGIDTWANDDFSLVSLCVIHMNAILERVSKILFFVTSFKMATLCLNLFPHIPVSNKLNSIKICRQPTSYHPEQWWQDPWRYMASLVPQYWQNGRISL